MTQALRTGNLGGAVAADAFCTLEIINLGMHPIMLYPEMEICQLIFERVDGVPRAAPSQFHGQTTPAGTK